MGTKHKTSLRVKNNTRLFLANENAINSLPEISLIYNNDFTIHVAKFNQSYPVAYNAI